jgi:energy-coupling factor transporter ATP-binding protein EcfA2
MQLLRLEVRNWVHHRHRVCEFTRGLVAILGENGSGKSSLFGALKWLLTGENPNYGSKTDNISQYAKEGEPSFASLEFEHSGHIAVVTRHLLPEKEQATLTIDGVEAGRGEKGVTAGIEKLLGVDAKFISRFIIVGQTEIFSFIDDNQTDTDKFFQRLFNTAKADKCQDVIGKNISKIQIPEVLKTPAQLDTEIQTAKDALSETDRQIHGLPDMAAFLAEQKEQQKTIQAWRNREKAAAELAKLDAQLQTANAQLETAKEDSDRYESDLEALEEASQGQEEAITAARTALGHWQSYKSVAKSREQLQTTRQAIAASRAKDPEPEKPGALSAEELAKDAHSRRERIKEINAFIRMFDEHGEAECPTCHTPSSQLADQVEKRKAELLVRQQEETELTLAYSAQWKLEEAWKRWESRERDRALSEQKLAAAEQSLQDVQPPVLSEADLSQTVTDYDSFQKAKQDILPLAQAAKVRNAQLEGALVSLAERRKQLLNDINEAEVTEADATLAQQRLNHVQEQFAQRTKLDTARATLVHARDALQAQRDAAEAEVTLAGRLREWTHVAETAREALKNAPRLVAQRNLQRLETSINELLQIFQVNFQVRVAERDTPTFIAEFYDGRRQVAQRLSIGQKTVLALAFRVAVNAMFAEEIGLLALDEPTASLDQPRIRALAPVLEKLRELSTAKGLQCLLVTHATTLSHLFESAIELEPPELRHASSN